MNERIEGVPVGTKLVRIGKPKMGDRYIDTSNGLILNCGNELYDYTYPIIVPDNVYGVIDLSVVPIPAGEELDGLVETSFRGCLNGDRYIASSGMVETAVCDCPQVYRLHVRKIKPKTRRVLMCVETRELTITDRPCGSIAEVHSSTAESLVKSQPHRYRIEERPL